MVTTAGQWVNDPSTGTAGLGEMGPGAHACALYWGPDERDRLVAAFMREGLRQGDRCVSLVDGPVGLLRRPSRLPGPGDPCRQAQVAVHPVSEVCLRAGELCGEQMISFLAAQVRSSVGAGLAVLRVAEEMSWLPQERGAGALSAHEAAVDLLLGALPGVFLCLFDLKRLGVGTLVQVMSAHSPILLDGSVLDRRCGLAPSHLPEAVPDALTAHPLTTHPVVRPRSDGEGTRDRWLTLTGAEVRVAHLVASGMTNRATAQELTVSCHTVDAHLKHMYVKLGIHSRVQLTVLALQHGPPVA